jgi:hypothetical protein
VRNGNWRLGWRVRSGDRVGNDEGISSSIGCSSFIIILIIMWNNFVIMSLIVEMSKFFATNPGEMSNRQLPDSIEHSQPLKVSSN